MHVIEMVPVRQGWGGSHTLTGVARTYAPRRERNRRSAAPHSSRRGVGAGTPAGQQVAAGASSIAAGVAELGTTSALSGTLLAASAIPIVGAVAAIAALVLHFVGGGCGQACISAAEAEQIYEAAADNLMAALKLGMIPRSAAVAGMQAFIQAGQQHEARFATANGQMTPQAKAGVANLEKVIQAEIAKAETYPDAVMAPLNLATVQANFVQPGAKGWYASSVSAGAQLALAFLQQIASSLPPVTSPLPSGSAPTAGTAILSPTSPGGSILTQAGAAIEQAVGISPAQVSPLVVIVIAGAGLWVLASMLGD